MCCNLYQLQALVAVAATCQPDSCHLIKSLWPSYVGKVKLRLIDLKCNFIVNKFETHTKLD